MPKAEQGDVLKVSSFHCPVVVVSKNFFNESGMVLACPLLPDATPGPLRIGFRGNKTGGYVYCEQLRIVDLNVRRFSKVDAVPYLEMIDIIDAIQSIFDYI